MPLAAGAQTTVTQSYSVGAAGTGRLTLTATGTNASNPGYYNVPILAPLAERFPSTVTGGYFTKDSRYLLQEMHLAMLRKPAMEPVAPIPAGGTA